MSETYEIDRADLEEPDSYRELADKVIELFNPPDEDMSEDYIIEKALDRAAKFIEAQPCTCTPAAAKWEDDPCARCAVLGRNVDVREER